MLEALKTHVSLQEALEIEAVMCVAGDRRHDFNTWASDEKNRNVGKRQFDPTSETLTIEAVREEIAIHRQAIEEHEELLRQHRIAVLDERDADLLPDPDGVQAVLDSLRANMPVLEHSLEELLNDG